MNAISRIKNSKLIKLINYWTIVSFVFLYAFSVPSFGSRQKLNNLVFAILGLLIISVVFYLIFFGKFKFNRYLLVVPAFTIFAFFGTAIYSHEFRGWLTLILLCLSFFVLFYAFRSIENKFIILTSLVAGLFVFSLYFIIHYRNEILHFSSYGSEAFRLGDYFDNQNDVAAYCLFGFLVSFYLLLFMKKLIKLVFILPTTTIFLVGLTTGSRTFILASILIIIFVLYFRFQHHKIIYLAMVASIIASFFILINIPFMATIKERLIKMISTFFTDSYVVDTSSTSRTIWLDYGFVLGSKHMVFGLGYGGFAIYSGVGTFTHSNLVEVFCDFGLPGLLLFYSPFVVLPYLLIKEKNKYLKLCLPVFLLYLSVSFSMVFFYNKIYYFALAMLFYLTIEGNNQCEYDKVAFDILE